MFGSQIGVESSIKALDWRLLSIIEIYLGPVANERSKATLFMW